MTEGAERPPLMGFRQAVQSVAVVHADDNMWLNEMIWKLSEMDTTLTKREIEATMIGRTDWSRRSRNNSRRRRARRWTGIFGSPPPDGFLVNPSGIWVAILFPLHVRRGDEDMENRDGETGCRTATIGIHGAVRARHARSCCWRRNSSCDAVGTSTSGTMPG